MSHQLLHARHWVWAELMLVTGFLFSCQPDIPKSTLPKTQTALPSASIPATAAASDFAKVQQIMATSCMPCHNRQNLPVVIDQVKQAHFSSIGGKTRLRILAELEGLSQLMQDGLPLSFTSQEELHQFFLTNPGSFYTMLEKGVMPPPWGPDLIKELNWPGYQALPIEDRLELMKYAKAAAQK